MGLDSAGGSQLFCLILFHPFPVEEAVKVVDEKDDEADEDGYIASVFDRSTQSRRSDGVGAPDECCASAGYRNRKQGVDYRMMTLEYLWYGNIDLHEQFLCGNAKPK